jgi:hypothetical protein
LSKRLAMRELEKRWTWCLATNCHGNLFNCSTTSGLFRSSWSSPLNAQVSFTYCSSFSELNDKERVRVLIFEALKLSQALGGLFLRIRTNVDTKIGCSLFCGR